MNYNLFSYAQYREIQILNSHEYVLVFPQNDGTFKEFNTYPADEDSFKTMISVSHENNRIFLGSEDDFSMLESNFNSGKMYQ